MSKLTLGINIASLQGQSNLRKFDRALGDVFTRLSTGQRINRASDDPAGLAIAEDLETLSKVLRQGSRNLNDGISLFNIADSALESLTNIIHRMEELAEQASNGVYTREQRQVLDTEAQALKDEFLRISQSTEFNDQSLFTGSLGPVNLQAGIGSDATISLGIGGAIGTGDGLHIVAESSDLGFQRESDKAVDFNGDGILDVLVADHRSGAGNADVTIALGTGNGGFTLNQEIVLLGTEVAPSNERYVQDLTIGDFNGDGVFDAAIANYGYYDSFATILLGNGDGTFSIAGEFVSDGTPVVNAFISSGDFNGDGLDDIVTSDSGTSATVFLATGSGGFDSGTTLTNVNNADALSVGDLNGDGMLDIVANDSGNTLSVFLNDGSGGFGSAQVIDPGVATSGDVGLVDVNNDGVLDLVSRGSGEFYTFIGQGDGSFNAAITTAYSGTAVSAIDFGDFNGDGYLDVTTVDGTDDTVTIYLNDKAGGFTETETTTSVNTGPGFQPINVMVGDFTQDGVDDILAIHTLSPASVLSVNTVEGVSPLAPFSLQTAAEARQALSQFKLKRELLSSQRGQIGANQSRLEVANRVIEAIGDQYLEAESRIRDADIAAETANLVRLNVLREAATSVLAQANQQSEIVLQLLAV